MSDEFEPPVRHNIFCLGPFSFYWIWINEGSAEHQHRGYIVVWHTKNNLIHLTHWKWWVPLRQLPSAYISARRVMRTAKASTLSDDR